MAGVVPLNPLWKFTDANGRPLAGGSVTVYMAGTTTLATTYQDADLTVPNINPVPLDANGEALFWVDPGTRYKLLPKNAAGVTLPGWPVDDIPGGNPDAALGADLATSSGASMVGFQQAGSGAAARSAQDKLRENYSAPDVAVAANGVADDGPKLNSGVTNSNDVLQVLRGDHLVDTQVSVSAFKHLHGRGHYSKIFAKGTPSISTLFRLNYNGTTWPDPFPNVNSTQVRGLTLDAQTAGAAGSQVAGFEFGGSQEFYNVSSVGLQQLARQVTSLFSDLVRFDRVYAEQQPSNAAGYIIDLQGSGDGVDINQGSFFRHYTDGADGAIDPASGRRVRAIRYKFKTGSTIRNILNGDIFLEDCNAVDVSSLHMEDGLLTFQRTSGIVRAGEMWMRGDGKGELSVTPLQFKGNSLNPVIGRAENVGFVYQPSFGGGYSTTKPNFSLASPTTGLFSGVVAVSNLYRRLSPRGGSESGSTGQRFGVTSGDADFDNYNHIASRESAWVHSGWHIRGALGALPASDAVIDTANSLLSAELVFGGASGTYFYKAAVLIDKKRRIGIVGTAEASLSPVNGGNAPMLFLSSGARVSGIIRVYRGTASGSYDSVVDVPLLAGARLLDSGSDIGGFAWTARAPGGVDALNALRPVAYSLAPGDTAATSDAYGNVRVVCPSSSTIPTTGAWRRGDLVEVAPTTALRIGRYQMRFAGWRRVDDCTEASPAHVLGTNWAQIYVVDLMDQIGRTVLDANVTLTWGTDPEIQRFVGAYTATRTITLAGGTEGAMFQVTHGGTGSSLDVGGLKTLVPNSWCTVVFSNAGWRLQQYGTL